MPEYSNRCSDSPLLPGLSAAAYPGAMPTAALAESQQNSARGRDWRVVGGGGLVAVIVALSATVPLARPQLLADPGLLVRWSLPIVGSVRSLALAATIGLLGLVAFGLPGARGRSVRGRLAPSGIYVLRCAALSAALWALAGVGQALLSYANIAGIGIFSRGFGVQFLSFAPQLEPVRNELLGASLAAVVCLGAVLAVRQRPVLWLAAIALVGLWPLALSGHSSTAGNHEQAVDSLLFHLLGVVLWLGGLLALGIARSQLGRGLCAAVERFSWLAGFAFLLVGGSGIINALVRLDSLRQLRSGYGMILLLKAILLGVLGMAGWWHRKSLLKRLRLVSGEAEAIRAPVARIFWRLVTAEVLLLGAALGLGVALSATPPPGGSDIARSDAVTEITGYPMPPELLASSWLTAWRVDLLWLSISGVLIFSYLRGYIRLRRRGVSWPVGRALSFIAGCLILVWATSGAPGIYGRVLFSAHMVGHMTVTMVVPPLLVLGAPITLFLRTWPVRQDGSWGIREWLLELVHSRALRWVGHPLIAAGIFAGSLVLFYFTGLFDLSLKTHTGHVLMHAHFLLSGYLFSSMLIGVDPGPARLAYPLRLVLLFATMAFHAFFGVAIVSGSQLLAADYFTGLNRPWGSSTIVDQQYGGAVTWALGEIPVLLLAMGIALAWVRSDDRQARREDRQADRDGDAELARYNRQLAELNARAKGSR